MDQERADEHQHGPGASASQRAEEQCRRRPGDQHRVDLEVVQAPDGGPHDEERAAQEHQVEGHAPQRFLQELARERRPGQTDADREERGVDIGEPLRIDPDGAIRDGGEDGIGGPIWARVGLQRRVQLVEPVQAVHDHEVRSPDVVGRVEAEGGGSTPAEERGEEDGPDDCDADDHGERRRPRHHTRACRGGNLLGDVMGFPGRPVSGSFIVAGRYNERLGIVVSAEASGARSG